MHLNAIIGYQTCLLYYPAYTAGVIWRSGMLQYDNALYLPICQAPVDRSMDINVTAPTLMPGRQWTLLLNLARRSWCFGSVIDGYHSVRAMMPGLHTAVVRDPCRSRYRCV